MGQFVLECCAYLAAAEGHATQALQAAGALEAMGVVIDELVFASLYGRGNLQLRLNDARNAVGEHAAATAIAEGRCLSILQVCQIVLSVPDDAVAEGQLPWHGTPATCPRRH
jgi:hypothetical protein